MGLLDPLNLLWLIPVAGAIIALYLLKLKRQERRISSVMLWAQAVQDVQANAPFQKLRKNLLLFLQVLAAVLLLGALAIPFYRAAGVAGHDTVIVIDNSASMNASDVRPDRLGAARKLGISLAGSVGSGDLAAVMTCAPRPRVVCPFTNDRRSLAGTISGITPTDAPADVPSAYRLATSLLVRRRDPQIVILSDGAFGSLETAQISGARIRFVRVGRRSDNVAITALQARSDPTGKRQVFVSIHNFSRRRKDFDLEFYADGSLTDVRQMSIAPGADGQEIIPQSEVAGRVFTVKADIHDDLAADNSASIPLSAKRELKILLVSKGSLFLERALALDPMCSASRTSDPIVAASGDYDIVVYDCVKPTGKPPDVGCLFINIFGPDSPLQSQGRTRNPEIIEWNRQDEVTRFVDFGGVSLGSAGRCRAASWARPLVFGSGGPLIAAGELRGSRRIAIGWDLLESDLPLRVGFPILISNCLEWLSARQGEGGDLYARAGEPAAIPVPPDAKRLAVRRPDGRNELVEVTGTPALYGDTDTAGEYDLRSGKWRRRLFVNVLNYDESDLRPRERISVARGKGIVTGEGMKSNREAWRLALLLALCLLCVEWFVYHRRV